MKKRRGDHDEHAPTVPMSPPTAKSTPAIADSGRRRPAPVPGMSFGPYQVIERIAAGGMGEVLRARDPALDRDVALKVLRAEDGDESRLLAEARAMAQLAHPNVVTVYDAGEIDGRVYLAMELVEGTDLRRWRHVRPRAPREIVEVFLGAGRGLAAAHRAGIAHRDFKPDNVIVGADGRARVVDFGIAAAIGSADRSEGTPEYMAPEGNVGPLADQFAFCVSLWEAFAGARPPEGESRVPGYVRELAVRGMRPDPAARFPSMDRLLAMLAHDPAARRRQIGTVSALVLLSGIAVYAVTRATANAPSCDGGRDRLIGAWDPARAAATEKAFLASGRPYAADTSKRVLTGLDAYAAEWAKVRTEVCEATHVRREQSTTLLDLRMACLDHHRVELGALTALFAARPDPEVLDRAVAATARLEPLIECARAELQADAPPLPAEPTRRATIVALRERLASLRAMRLAGKAQLGLTTGKQLLAESEAAGYPPLLAEVLEELLSVQALSRDTKAHEAMAERLLVAAAAARDDRRIATAWVLLATDAMELGRPAETLTMRRRVEATISRSGDEPRLRGRLQNAVGRAQRALGELAGSAESFAAAIAIVQGAELRDGWLELAAHESALGVTLRQLGRYEAARIHAERAHRLWLEHAGPANPQTTGNELNLANLLAVEGRFGDARGRYEAVLASWELTQGPESPEVALVLTNLAELDWREGRSAEGRPRAERALALKEKAWGTEDRRLVSTLLTLGALLADDEDARTEAVYRRALAIAEKNGGRAQADAVEALLGLALLARKRGETRAVLALVDEATPLLEKALPAGAPRRLTLASRFTDLLGSAGRKADAIARLREIWQKQDEILAPDDEARAFTLTALGQLLPPNEARPMLERAVAFYDGHRVRPADEARARAALARAR